MTSLRVTKTAVPRPQRRENLAADVIGNAVRHYLKQWSKLLRPVQRPFRRSELLSPLFF